jgi:hypothetical protein
LTCQLSKNTGGDTLPKKTDASHKRKCLFPYLNDAKKISSDDQTKVLLELNDFYVKKIVKKEGVANFKFLPTFSKSLISDF